MTEINVQLAFDALARIMGHEAEAEVSANIQKEKPAQHTEDAAGC